MKFKILSPTVFLIACTVCFLPIKTFSQNVVNSQRTASYTSKSYAYKLTEQDFADTPSWNPEADETPLSVSRAVKIARENLPRFVKNAESWKFQTISLQSMGEGKWYYRIHFSCMGAVCREIEDRMFMAIVKMDGKIVEPKKVTIED